MVSQSFVLACMRSVCARGSATPDPVSCKHEECLTSLLYAVVGKMTEAGEAFDDDTGVAIDSELRILEMPEPPSEQTRYELRDEKLGATDFTINIGTRRQSMEARNRQDTCCTLHHRTACTGYHCSIPTHVHVAGR